MEALFVLHAFSFVYMCLSRVVCISLIPRKEAYSAVSILAVVCCRTKRRATYIIIIKSPHALATGQRVQALAKSFNLITEFRYGLLLSPSIMIPTTPIDIRSGLPGSLHGMVIQMALVIVFVVADLSQSIV